MAVKVFEPDEIRKAINIMKPDNELFEIRCHESDRRIHSGYFRSADTAFEALRALNPASGNIYITLNHINDSCYSRGQRDRFITNAKPTTSDTDIDGYEFLFVDADPRRSAGVSSSDEQVQQAKETGNRVYAFMKNLGFNEPVTAMSGNGIHLLYRIRLKNNKENEELIKKCLKVLDMFFSTDDVAIDTANYNPARICKLYGTMARKGSNTLERPHRMSCMLSEGGSQPTDKVYLEKLAQLLPAPEKPQKYNRYNPQEFDLEEWLIKYGLGYRKTGYSDGTKYVLDQCPFNGTHTGKDACIFQSRSGAIGFHCFHNSCSDKTWHDVRLLFEPDAYEKRQQDYEQRIYSRQPVKIQPVSKAIQPEEGKPVFYTARNILDLPTPDERFVKTGITGIDMKLRGLKKSYVSVMSGLRAAGKSSVISEIILDGIDAGNRIAVFSGELAPKNFMRWMNLQAAGRGYTEPTQFEGYYNVRRQYQERIAEWLGKNFWLYNNEYGNDFKAIGEQFESLIETEKLDLLILDNLMAFNITSLAESKYDAQTAFVMELQRLAKKYNVHILFVAHPRKSQGFLRLDDISGTADLANAVDNAFIIHRVNSDFKRLSKLTFGWDEEKPIYDATNVIEIAKDRDGGTQDEFIQLYYEPETKRLKNFPAENKIYGWNRDNKGFSDADQSEIPF